MVGRGVGVTGAIEREGAGVSIDGEVGADCRRTGVGCGVEVSTGEALADGAALGEALARIDGEGDGVTEAPVSVRLTNVRDGALGGGVASDFIF